jgi:hypothetical protein
MPDRHLDRTSPSQVVSVGFRNDELGQEQAPVAKLARGLVAHESGDKDRDLPLMARMVLASPQTLQPDYHILR